MKKLPLFEDLQSVACAPVAKVFHFQASNFQIQFFSCHEHFEQPLDFSIFVGASFDHLTNGQVDVFVVAFLRVLHRIDPRPKLEVRIFLILAEKSSLDSARSERRANRMFGIPEFGLTSSMGMRSAILLSSYFVDVRFDTGSKVTGDGAATIFFV